jgi:predicted PurR-regulated permease PerM
MDAFEDGEEPGNLRFLRRLVTVLTLVMICGVLVVIALLVTRLNGKGPEFPREITLPDGATATAFTQGTGWYAVVTDENQILIYDQLTGNLRQRIDITP